MLMTRIDHIGVYVSDLEAARRFFVTYLTAEAGGMYQNPVTGFSSYFLSFGDSSRLEIMTRKDIGGYESLGECHISMSVGSKDEVDRLTSQLTDDGYELLGAPRTTGDGYYESKIRGIDAIIIEITV